MSTFAFGDRVKTFIVCPDYTAGAHGPVMIVIWHKAPTVASFRALDRHVMDHRDSLGGKAFAVLILIDSASAAAPDRRARLEHARLCEKYEREMLATALVLRGTSMKQTMLRLVMSTMQLMSPSQIAQQIFESSEAAAEWIEQIVPGASAPGLLTALLALQGCSPSDRLSHSTA